jgi:O-antigen ligase
VTIDVVAPGHAHRAADRARTASFTPVLVAFVPLVGLAAAQGGYFPTSWGWAAVPLLWAAAVAVVGRQLPRLGSGERIFLAALAGFVAWIALSVLWSPSPAVTVVEVERALVYVGASLALLLVATSRSLRPVAAAVLAAIVVISAFSLATRLVPDRIGVFDPTAVYRLAQPIGYWNGLAAFAVIGVLLAGGFATRARTIGGRAAGAAALVLLVPTLYFTFSRGGWIALGVGIVAALACDPSRLQQLAVLAVLTPAAAIAVTLASRQQALTHLQSALPAAAHEGHRLAVLILVLAIVNAGVAAAIGFAEQRVEVPDAVRHGFAVAVGSAVAAGALFVLVHEGGPVRVAHRAYSAFNAPLPQTSGSLNQRLLSFSGNGRSALWRLAWQEATAHPLLGAGAGTYERWFLAHEPPQVSRVRDAHSLYMETLAELGPIGLALLVAMLATPFAALPRARRHPLVPALAGAYAAYVVHTGVDWDWELPAVTLAGIFCGLLVLLAARRDGSARALDTRVRWGIAAGSVAVTGFAGAMLIANISLSRSNAARASGNISAAVTDARRAHTLMPWSPAPWDALGKAQLAAGAVGQARQSLRKAVSLDPGDWRLWYDLAGATSGSAHQDALHHAGRLYPQADLVGGSS